MEPSDYFDELRELHGAVPPAVAQAAIRLIEHSRQFRIPVPADIGYDWAISAVDESTLSIRALSDARSLLTAFLREIADPRPSMKELAKAQSISPTTLRRRYKPEHVTAIKHLIDNSGRIDDILRPFDMLFDFDLAGISEERDQELAIRDKLAKAYEAVEVSLAGTIGIPIPDEFDEENPYYLDPAFESNTLHPRRRRRLLSDYKEKIMDEALVNDPELAEIWKQWKTKPPRVRQEDPETPPF
ncbi:hypothetical protein ACFQRD_11730 [Brachybacterium sp. GCM10030268]|uniref:hypothetical protein n=1 Tax=Brachybacterium sp. GCM10030268 TaxID=3273382 RepID=UPI0036227B61